LADYDILWQLLQWLAHRTYKLQLSLEYRVGLDRLREEFAFLAEDLEQVLGDARLQGGRQIV